MRDFHLGKMRHEVKLLNSEIMYGFIDKDMVTLDKFEIFLNNRGAKSWMIPVLWNEFKNNKYTNNGNKTIQKTSK